MKKISFILIAALLSGCSQQEPAAPKPPVSAHDHILSAEDAPEGYEYSNINELMSTEDHSHRGPRLQRLRKDHDPRAMRTACHLSDGFHRQDLQESGYILRRRFQRWGYQCHGLSQHEPRDAPFPADLVECASFSNGVSGIVSDYSTAPLDMQIEGAENLQAAKVTIENAGNPLVGGPGESEFVANR